MDQNLFQDDIEKNQHEKEINRLCEEYPEQCELIRKNYLSNLAPLLADASIRTYLPIIRQPKSQKRTGKQSLIRLVHFCSTDVNLRRKSSNLYIIDCQRGEPRPNS